MRAIEDGGKPPTLVKTEIQPAIMLCSSGPVKRGIANEGRTRYQGKNDEGLPVTSTLKKSRVVSPCTPSGKRHEKTSRLRPPLSGSIYWPRGRSSLSAVLGDER